MKRGRVGFLKPREDDDLGSGYQEDRPDLDTNSQTTFVYNPYQVNPQHSCHSPSCEWQSSSESGHWQTESSPSHCRLQRQSTLPAGDSPGEFEGQMSDDCKRLTAADGGGGGGDGQWQVHPAAAVPAGGRLRCRGRQDDLCDGASEDRGDQPGGQSGAGEESEAGGGCRLQHQVTAMTSVIWHLTSDVFF